VSAATSEWPAWLRRRTAVELLGPPGRFFAWLTIALCLGAIVYVGAWNAAKYPIPLGFDAQADVDYAHVLLTDHRLPTAAESGSSSQPPAYFAVAGLAARAGHAIFGWHEDTPYTSLPETSYRGAQILNIALVLITALSVLWLARLLAPDRPWVWAASVGYVAFVPVVAKTAAMFHPENLNMAATAVALATSTHMLVRRTFRLRYVALVALSLALAITSRASGVFLLLALALSFAVVLVRRRDLRARVPWRRVGVVVGALCVLAVPWVAYRAIVHHSGPINDTGRVLRVAVNPGNAHGDGLATRANFFNLSTDVFRTPWRPSFVNQAFPETYVEIWGDWIGGIAWSNFSPDDPWPPTRKVLKDQSYIGIVPTLLAIAGWLWMCVATFRRRPELIVLSVFPVLAVGGYLYRAWLLISRDGDLLKATYAIATVPVWAVGFGLATSWLATRSRNLRVAMLLLFAFFAVLELRFMMYGIRDHRPIF
jgi:hypothetical protein